MPSNNSKYTATDTITYTYQTGTDKLISYNGESIVYDGVLNPTTYRGKTLTWEQEDLLLLLMETTGMQRKNETQFMISYV